MLNSQSSVIALPHELTAIAEVIADSGKLQILTKSSHYPQVADYGDRLIALAQQNGLDLEILADGQTMTYWPKDKFLKVPMPAIATPEFEQNQRPIGVVTMRENICISNSRGLRALSSHAGEVGVDVSRWHLPEELQRFQRDLQQHTILTGYQYRAIKYTGELTRFTVNAWLTTYCDRPVRIVEMLHSEPAE